MDKRKTEKLKKDRGEAYVSATGIPRLGKKMRNPCLRYKCRLNCQARVTANDRKKIFDEFYGLGDTHSQWEYIAQRLGRIVPKFRSKKSTRNLNLEYNFLLNGKKVRVCKVMFIHTLNVSDGVCVTALNKCNENGVLIQSDQRGHHSKPAPHGVFKNLI